MVKVETAVLQAQLISNNMFIITFTFQKHFKQRVYCIIVYIVVYAFVFVRKSNDALRLVRFIL